MNEAVLPLMKYIFFQLCIIIIGLNVVTERKMGSILIAKCWIFGQMLMFSVMQLLSVPMILLRLRFNTLFGAIFAFIILLFCTGLFSLKKHRITRESTYKKPSLITVILCITIFCIIAMQFSCYLFGMHLDEDDARWLAIANDALETGDMVTRSYNTGEYVGTFSEIRDVTSPWPIMYAFFARMINTRASIFAHTIYAPVELLALYVIYFLIGTELYKTKEAGLFFVLFISIINVFFTETVYTSSTFALIRIWQGKASVAGIIIPLISYVFICINKRNHLSDWMKLIITGCAACLMSGMGVTISIVLIGLFGIYNLIFYKNWKRMHLYLLSLFPSVTSGIIHLILKG